MSYELRAAWVLYTSWVVSAVNDLVIATTLVWWFHQQRANCRDILKPYPVTHKKDLRPELRVPEFSRWQQVNKIEAEEKKERHILVLGRRELNRSSRSSDAPTTTSGVCGLMDNMWDDFGEHRQDLDCVFRREETLHTPPKVPESERTLHSSTLGQCYAYSSHLIANRFRADVFRDGYDCFREFKIMVLASVVRTAEGFELWIADRAGAYAVCGGDLGRGCIVGKKLFSMQRLRTAWDLEMALDRLEAAAEGLGTGLRPFQALI
ncbi:hypothetical protein C8R44DRAFT_752724 [Mycena epipterygia]|nr:hypothetical protein C8R44DRAFT_752724 [Mycena epipterygia]